MKPKKGQFVDAAKGAPGNFRLNQHAPSFGDRRTKRNRDRAAKTRKAIEDSKEG